MRRLGLTLAIVSIAAPLTLMAGASPAVGAKAKKCGAQEGASVTITGIHARGLSCGEAREFALAYALASSKKAIAAELNFKCKRTPAAAPEAFRVNCTGKDKLVRFKYRPS
jgi:hypothetical protein